MSKNPHQNYLISIFNLFQLADPKMEPLELKIKINNIITSHGFIASGISEPAKLSPEENYFRRWLRDGKNAGMKWLNNTAEKRTNPYLVMPDVKSVISLAYLYDTPFNHPSDANIPKISRYAWGSVDYHKLIKKKLKSICWEIEELKAGIKTIYYVDDGPVMDKVWAVKSGIGWMGKHTNVINPDFGSFFFLSEILLNIELLTDNPIDDLCGTCRICMDACPTGAISGEYSLDSNLCISYHTIENREEIPAYINLDGWIFGCDVCQDVCPFNNKKFFTNDTGFYPKESVFNKTQEELLSLSEEQFQSEFSGTPVKRTKYTGWRRNLNNLLH